MIKISNYTNFPTTLELFSYLEAFKSLTIENDTILNKTNIDVWVYVNGYSAMIKHNDKLKL